MGRTLPSICEHGRMVDGGDFALSEHCPECEARVRSRVTVNAQWLAELQREHEAMQHDIERMQAREVELLAELERQNQACRYTADLCEQYKVSLAEARGLLSSWYETWNDGFNPDGDLLDDTDKAIAGQGGSHD